MQTRDSRIDASAIRIWKNGRIVVRGGELVAIHRRLIPWSSCMARVWWQAKFRPGDVDECVLDYRSSRSGGFVVLQFIRSGPSTQLATFRRACQILDEVARLRQCVAILAHVSNDAISDRLLTRWGWERHALDMAGRHWIKRFYNGYPNHKKLQRTTS